MINKDQWLHFIGNNFELLFYLNLGIIIFIVALILSLEMTVERFIRICRKTFRGLMAGILVVGQFLLLATIVYTFSTNYLIPAPLMALPEDISSDTAWIEDHQRIFFIEDKTFNSIRINGAERKILFSANDPIRGYHFSPDAGHILIITLRELYLYNQTDGKVLLIEAIGREGPQTNLKGVISGIRWSVDGNKFCYQVMKWSRYASQTKSYVYDIEQQKKRQIINPAGIISDMYWDMASENIYYFQYESKFYQKNVHGHVANIFKVPMKELKPEFLATVPVEELSPPVDHLQLRDIDLFVHGAMNSFRVEEEIQLTSNNDKPVGVDKQDYFYIMNERWFKRRLFKVPREQPLDQSSNYPYPGELMVKDIKWLPGKKYVLMRYDPMGFVILDPRKGKIGKILGVTVQAVGWPVNMGTLAK